MFHRLKSWYENKIFSSKIFYSYLFFCIIPFLLTTIITSAFFINILLDRTESSITDSNDKLSGIMKNKLNQYEYVVNNLICDPTFLCIVQDPADIMTSYEINRYLNEQMTGMQVSIPEMKGFTVFTNSGYENDSFRPLSEVAQDTKLSYALKQNGSTWYNKDGEIYAAYPIKELYSRTPIGLITLHLDMQQLVNGYTQMGLDEYGIYMFGSNGDALYNKEVFSFEIGNITERMLNAANSRLRTAGRYFITDYAEISSCGISIYCIVPENSVYRPIKGYLVLPVLIWLICLALVIILCLFLSRSLGKRVRLLESQMNNVSNGDLTVFEPEDIQDEIGNISRFCSMAIIKLNQLINDNYISQIKLQDAKTKALIAQINPHFLYNTLNMIASQAIMSENQIIADVVNQLSNYYRTTLNKGKNLIPIKDEILNVRAYCNLQLRLHDYSFQIYFDIDEAIYEFTTITLCLQPLVENAIEHGINNLIDDEGFIRVSAKKTDDIIVFEVINNGCKPFKGDPNDLVKIKTKGYGLKNIQDRIHIIFGEEFGLSLSTKDSRFYAVLKIPASLPPTDIADRNSIDFDS